MKWITLLQKYRKGSDNMRRFEKPSIEIVLFDTVDIIKTESADGTVEWEDLITTTPPNNRDLG